MKRELIWENLQLGSVVEGLCVGDGFGLGRNYVCVVGCWLVIGGVELIVLVLRCGCILQWTDVDVTIDINQAD